MARRRRRKKDESEALAGGLLLIFIFVWGYMQSNPLLTSVICAGAVPIIVFGSLWLRQRLVIRQLNQAAGRQLYIDFTPRQFEEAVADLFRAQGYKAKVTPASGDGGLDILLTKNGKRYGVECKQYKNQIGPKFIRDFIGALQLRKLRAGFFVTTSTFSDQARATAKDSDYAIKLLVGEALGRWQRHVQAQMGNGRTVYTAFIPFGWWLKLSRGQQWIIAGLLFLVLGTAAFAGIYYGGIRISLL